MANALRETPMNGRYARQTSVLDAGQASVGRASVSVVGGGGFDRIVAVPLPGMHRIVLCCRSGARARRAAQFLRKTRHEDLALMALG